MLPKPLYEALPYGYVLVGVLTITGIEPIFGKVCGIALIAIGIFIYQTRMRYRHRKQQIVAYGGIRHPGVKRTDSHGEPISRGRASAAGFTLSDPSKGTMNV